MEYGLTEYRAAIIAAAQSRGQVYIDELMELAAFEDFSEEDIKGLLEEFREMRVDIAAGEKFIPEKHNLRELLKEIRSCDIEKEMFSGNTGAKDPVRLYFDDLAEIGMLTPAEETDLIYEIADGNDQAVERLIEGSLYIPVIAAYNLLGRNALFLDLVQEGNVELMAAAEEFDASSGTSFSGYASFRIYRYLLKLTSAEPSAVKLPTGLAEDIAAVIRQQRIIGKSGKKPSVSAIAASLGISEERVAQAIDALEKAKAEDKGGNADAALKEYEQQQQQTEKSDAEKQLSMQVSQMLSALPEKEARVISMRYGVDGNKAMTAEEIAEVLDEDIEVIRNLEEDALKHLGN